MREYAQHRTGDVGARGGWVEEVNSRIRTVVEQIIVAKDADFRRQPTHGGTAGQG